MARTQVCRNCGRALDPSQNFCGGCGVSVMADADPTDPYVGRLIEGKYLIEQLVGSGAMGVVYRAKQVSLNKRVAVKILRRALLGDTTVAARFKQEARAASRLNHPNTIQILDFGELTDVGLYMAMEFVEGRDLGKVIQQDVPMSARRVVRILKQALCALDEAHGVQIIHRDVKPANILVSNLRSQADFVKVLDFGIAKIIDPDPSESVPMTRDGFVCGTPAFMSPEQVQGMPLDPRTDLFSLGIVLYQCLTGRLPFEADSAVEMATKIVLEQPPTPRAVCPEWGISPALEAVVLRAMQKNRDHRYQSASEMLAALEQVESLLPPPGAERPGQPPQAVPGPRPVSSQTAPAGPPPVEAPPRRAVVGLPFPLGTGSRGGLGGRSAGAAALAAPPVAAVPLPDLPPEFVPTIALPSVGASLVVPRSPAPAPGPRPAGSQVSVPTRPLARPALDLALDTADEQPRLPPGLGASTGFRVTVGLAALVVIGLASLGLGHLLGGWFAAPPAPPGAGGGSATVALATAPALPVEPPTGDCTSSLADSPEFLGGLELPSSSPSAPSAVAVLPAPAARLAPAARPAPAAEPAAAAPARPRPVPRPAPASGAKTQQARALHAEGMALMQSDWREALARLQQAAALAPGLAEVYRDMGKIEIRHDLRPQALAHYRRYLQLAPTARDADVYRAIVEDRGAAR